MVRNYCCIILVVFSLKQKSWCFFIILEMSPEKMVLCHKVLSRIINVCKHVGMFDWKLQREKNEHMLFPLLTVNT